MKRPIISLIATALAGNLPCFADPVVVPPDATPAQVAPAPAAPDSANPTILVMPFASAGSGDRDWISKGIQQDLTADLIRSSRLHVVAPTDLTPAQDSDAALKFGRDNRAAFVIFGHFQVVETNVRITGQVLDAATGQSIGALKATGPTRDLFNMEDALSGQVISSLPKRLLADNASQPTSTPMPYVYEPNQTTPAPTYSDESGYYAPQTYVQAPSPYGTADYSYAPQTYTPNLDNSYYGYGSAPYYPYYYNYWYPGFGFVVIGAHHHDHDHRGDGDGHFHGTAGGGHIVTGGVHAGVSGGFSHGGFHASGGGFHGGSMHGGGGGHR